MLVQSYHDKKTVLQAARERIAFVFDHIDNIILSISGGKDSSVLAHLVLTEAHRRSRRVGLFFLDEEVMYQSSVEQVEHIMTMFPESSRRLWLQIPFFLTNATSFKEGQLRCWEPGEHHLWMRHKGSESIKFKPWDEKDEKFRQGYKWLDFYGVIENFERCYHNTAFLVGLRAAGESPNRWRAVVKNPVTIGGKRVYWATKKGDNTALY